MKTFKDLEFRSIFSGCGRARLDFENGYGISVVFGPLFHSDNGTYEVAVLNNGALCYDTPITCDVIGYASSDYIDEIMEKLQSYVPNQY